MSDSKTSPKRDHTGIIVLVLVAVAGWQIYDLATATETPSLLLRILEYAILAGALIALVGFAIQTLSRR